MTQPMEHDWPPTMGPRRGRRRPRIEVLPPQEEEPQQASRITIEHRHVVHHRQRQQTIPPWAIAVLFIGVLCWISPLGTVIALVMIGLFVTAHPTFVIAIAILLVLFIGIAVRERLARRPF